MGLPLFEVLQQFLSDPLQAVSKRGRTVWRDTVKELLHVTFGLTGKAMLICLIGAEMQDPHNEPLYLETAVLHLAMVKEVNVNPVLVVSRGNYSEC